MVTERRSAEHRCVGQNRLGKKVALTGSTWAIRDMREKDFIGGLGFRV